MAHINIYGRANLVPFWTIKTKRMEGDEKKSYLTRRPLFDSIEHANIVKRML